MNRPSLRFRLTILVTSFFVVALLAAGWMARQRLAQSLEETATTNATAVLQDSIAPEPVIEDDGSAAVVSGVTRLVFFDQSGQEINQLEFSEIVNSIVAADLAEQGFFFEIPVAEAPVFSDLAFGPVLGGSVQAITVEPIFQLVGEINTTRNDEAILVTQDVLVGDTELVAAVATPVEPLNESLAAFTRLGLVLIPLVGALVAAATWLTTSRVLQPVEDIRRQVELTDPRSLDRHVPRSGNGDEIDRLAGTMNAMLDRLHAAAQRQRQFVSDASHELRSPITATIATLDTTTAEQAAQQWPDIAATLDKEQQRLARLVDDLLMLATFDESPTQLHDGATVDLDEIALAEAERPYPVKVEARIETPQRVEGKQRLLERCVGNLVENATRHAESLVIVTVAASAEGRPLLVVDDDGPGIPDDQLDVVFERFTRLDDARNRNDGGAGLGLSIARNIAEQHGAKLIASRSPIGGARFELCF